MTAQCTTSRRTVWVAPKWRGIATAVVWRAVNRALHNGFPGQYYDKETGFWYNRHRDYDPSTDRYLQPEPLGLYGGINPYLYANGNPLMKRDPLGLWSFIAGGYNGPGAELTFGNDNEHWCISFRGSYGYGIGISYDLNGGTPGGVSNG